MGFQRASRLISSNLLRRIVHPIEAPIMASSTTRAHLSSAPNRPTRGGGRDDNRRRSRDGRGGPSEDDFIRSLSFGDEKPVKARQGSPFRTAKGERRPNEASGDFFSDLNFKSSEKLGLMPTPDRHPRAEQTEGLEANGNFEGNLDFLKQRKGETIDSSFRTGESKARERGNGGLGDALFEKLNLGYSGRVGKAEGTEREKVGRMRLPDRPPRTEWSEGLEAKGGDVEGKHDLVKQRSGETIDSSLKSSDSLAKERGNGRLGGTLFEKLNLGNSGTAGKAEGSERKPESDGPAVESSTQDADEIFKKMKETGLIPNAVAMLDGLCKDGLIQEAMKLFGLMREKGTIPEVVIYTAVVEGFCKAAKFDDAKRIFRKMLQNGIEPNAFSYTVLVQGLCKGGRLEDAVEFSIAMLDAGHSLNAATLTGLVDAFCTDKGPKEAEDVLQRLRERGFVMDEKAVREYMDKKGPFSKMAWEAIFGKKTSQRPF